MASKSTGRIPTLRDARGRFLPRTAAGATPSVGESILVVGVSLVRGELLTLRREVGSVVRSGERMSLRREVPLSKALAVRATPTLWVRTARCVVRAMRTCWPPLLGAKRHASA